jgi:hypothetical protein
MEWTWSSRNTARNTNAEEYKDILTRCVLFTVEDQFGDDNVPCHKAKCVREWFVNNNVPEMD